MHSHSFIIVSSSNAFVNTFSIFYYEIFSGSLADSLYSIPPRRVYVNNFFAVFRFSVFWQ